MVQSLALVMGSGALAAAAFTQSVAVAPATTVQAGTHAANTTKPMASGLIPSSTPKSKSTTGSADTDTLYDYINPCLIPLDAVRKITGNYRLQYDTKYAQMTTNIAEAGQVQLADPTMPPVCAMDPGPDYVKPTVFTTVKTQQSFSDFMALRKQWNDDSYYNAQDVEVGGLPSAREAFAAYAQVGNERAYFLLCVHTKYNQVLIVKWSGANGKPAMPVLRQLAHEALSTLDGSRYAGIGK